MKKTAVLLFFLLITTCTFATSSECYRNFSQNPDILFMSAVAAIDSSNQLELCEIQSKNGYILFSKGSKFYLLTLTKKYQNQTEIKILPQDSNYNDNNEVAKAVFSLIDFQLKYQKMEQVK